MDLWRLMIWVESLKSFCLGFKEVSLMRISYFILIRPFWINWILIRKLVQHRPIMKSKEFLTMRTLRGILLIRLRNSTKVSTFSISTKTNQALINNFFLKWNQKLYLYLINFTKIILLIVVIKIIKTL
jgi:hypothetical protein